MDAEQKKELEQKIRRITGIKAAIGFGIAAAMVIAIEIIWNASGLVL